MIPVDQEFTHKPEIGQHGDCQRAVIASLLDLPISEVPHFLEVAKGDASQFWDELQGFLNKLGYAWLVVPVKLNGGFYGGYDHDIYHEISGPSPRGNGITHAVVGKNGNIFFDPHPDKTGLAGDPNEWTHGYLVKICN